MHAALHTKSMQPVLCNTADAPEPGNEAEEWDKGVCLSAK